MMPNPFTEIGVSDVLDIAFVATLVYAAIVWLRRTRAAFVMIGIVILGAIYAAAREFGLQLTAYMFQAFFAVFVIMIVVIFQEELRALFERIAVLSLRRRDGLPIRSHTIDVLVACLTDFSKERTGALVVVAGKDPIARHIDGGIELGARISEPLLKSIFDTSSPGHDGAVLIDNDRITRFAAHLPLSNDFQQLADVGTRHSAALGLAELTDALCLVVSEQTGRISAARYGRLRRLDGAQELAFVLHGFLEERTPRTSRWKFVTRDLVRRNWPEKVAGLGIAAVLWYLFVPGSKLSEVTYRIPVHVENAPITLKVAKVEPSEIRATFSGPRRTFYLFDPDNLRVAIDASSAKAGRKTYRLDESDVAFPKELSLDSFQPSSVRVEFAKNGTRPKPTP